MDGLVHEYSCTRVQYSSIDNLNTLTCEMLLYYDNDSVYSSTRVLYSSTRVLKYLSISIRTIIISIYIYIDIDISRQCSNTQVS